ncbi:uncharacterized protein CXQ87_005274 [Candidozyma duobushaemuli]|uniref:PUM-HD domain-containing protein n=2 Tax=Candidozyma TaxID=3303203 RepID=A0ABX8IBS5_9ASCO|nr:uncharacterized protein CXQ87_005274 [[Candida] duobushaemulonis]PVH14995.1 hypothetical protein CXQ87_005274 [[Candida] duobushaemulonis]QWU89934.1 hypothetical protein CA3LBN_004292 [[Candida] haemuloni]
MVSPREHSHNLSINSISSIVEPTTPPSATTNSKLWDQQRLNGSLSLPSFSLEAKETTPLKIDKDYLASVSKAPLSSLRSHVLRLAKDQYGCRFLQKRIDENVVPNRQARVANYEIIFKEVAPSLYELIIDPFGNYLVQKLVDYCSEADLDLMLDTLHNNLFSVSINQHGTRALQKVIDHMSNSHQLALLMKGLKPYIIELIKDLNGNHVIQKILNKYPPDNCQFIYSSIIEDILVVATHKHGCCVLQKCLNHVNPSQLSAFSEKILQYNVFVVLINDQFGNYVLQYLVSIDSVDVNCALFNNFLKYGINDLCNLKFSSNVVEKLMKNCYHNEPKSRSFTDLKFSVIGAIFNTDLNKLINDPYGNYVIQTLIDILINHNVTYYHSSDRSVIPSLQQLLPPNYIHSSDSLQIQVIKHWFQNCKIVSSFGKRIQSKINIILNGVKSSGRKHQQVNHGNMIIPPTNVMSNQNMNANGEFIQSRTPMAPYPFQANSMAMNNGTGYNKGYNGYQRNNRSNHSHQYYDGYAMNRSLGPSPVPRDSQSSFDSLVDPSLSATASLANLHISAPVSAPIDQSTVSYNNANPQLSNFISNDFTRNAGYSMANPGIMAGARSSLNGQYGVRPDRGHEGLRNSLQYSGMLPSYSGAGHQGFSHQQNSSYPGNINFFKE